MVFLAMISALALSACNASKNAYVPPPPPKVVVAQPMQQPVTLYFELTGNTQAINSVDLVARVEGYLRIDRLQGRLVRNQGDAAVRHRARQLSAQLDQANATLAANRATLEYNTAEYQRQSTLGKKDFASRATVQQWKANQDSAAAQS